MPFEVKVTRDLKGWKQFKKVAISDFNKGSGEARGLYKVWARIYRTALYKRFIKSASGGGRWKVTKKSTRKKKGNKLILRDTDTLLRSLTPQFKGLPGQFERIKGSSIEVGIGGPGKHPSEPLTVGQLASFHQEGAGNYPARKIIVRPSPAVNAEIRKVTNKFMAKLSRKTAIVK